MALIACALDGALFDTSPYVDMRDPCSVKLNSRANASALHHARQLASKHLFAYVTTRAPILRGVTLLQLRVTSTFPAGELHMMPTTPEGGEVAWKARVLDQIRADAFVGSSKEDREAARAAGRMFFDAADFRVHGIRLPPDESPPPAKRSVAA